MKMKKFLTPLLAALLLAGCAAPAEGPGPTKTTPVPETTAPELPEDTTPVPTDPLPEIAPEDRCAATSLASMVETENGYYAVFSYNYLCYADKSDMKKWVLVCNRPDCDHSGMSDCPAQGVNELWGRDGKLYTLADLGGGSGTDQLILESSGDGSGWTCAFRDPESPFLTQTGRGWSPQAYEHGVCLNISQMRTDGYWENFLYFVDDTGVHKYVYKEDFPNVMSFVGGNSGNSARGDLTIGLSTEFQGSYEPDHAKVVEGDLHRVSPEKIEKLEFPQGCDYYGSYLLGDTMIHYHPNDGFYRLSLSLGREVKLADAAYTDGYGYCLDGKFLVETTLTYEHPTEDARLRIFDGEAWMEVALPPEMGDCENFRIQGMSSEYLFFTWRKEPYDRLYAVDLETGELTTCIEFNYREKDVPLT